MIPEFLKPPTDNLYKFTTICGLILILLSVTYPPWLINKIKHSYLENIRDYEMLNEDLKQTDRKRELLLSEQELLTKNRTVLSRQLSDLENTIAKSRLTRTDKASLKKDLDRLDEVRLQIEEKNSKWTEKAIAITDIMVAQQKNLIAIKFANEAALWDSRSANVITVFAVMLGIVGVYLFRRGFNLWSSRVQAYQDVILKKEAEAVEATPASDS